MTKLAPPFIMGLFGFLAASPCLGLPQPQAAGVPDSAAAAKPLKVGAKAPNSIVRDVNDKAVELKEVLGRPTVLVFYRGGWCPFCNAHLADLSQVQTKLADLGYQIVAISPDTPEELSKTVEKHRLSYRVFSDSKAEAIRNFGLAFRVDDQTFSMYRERFGLDLERVSGATHHILPVPSVFIVDRAGTIRFASSNPDYKVRLKGAEVLAAAREAAKTRARTKAAGTSRG